MSNMSASKCAVKLVAANAAAGNIISSAKLKQLFDSVDTEAAKRGFNAIEAANFARDTAKNIANKDAFNAYHDKYLKLDYEVKLARVKAAVERMNMTRSGKAKVAAIKVIDSLIGGNALTNVGSRDSVAGSRDAMFHRDYGNWRSTLKKEGLDYLYRRNGELDKAIFEARAKASDASVKTPNIDALDPKTQKDLLRLGKIESDIFERNRIEANNNGALVGKHDGWTGEQTHDGDKIVNAANESFMYKRLGYGTTDYAAQSRKVYGDFLDRTVNWEKTRKNMIMDGRILESDPFNIQKMKDSLYEIFATGVRKTEGNVSYIPENANIAKKMSKSRILEFNTPADAAEYNAKYGSGSAFDQMEAHIKSNAHNIVTMRNLSANPKNFIEALYSHLSQLEARDTESLSVTEQNQQFKLAKETHEKWQKSRELLDAYMGVNQLPGNMTMQKLTSQALSLSRLNKLGGSLFTQLLQDPFTNVLRLNQTGLPILDSIFKPMKFLADNFADPNIKNIAHSVGVGYEGMLGHIASQGGDDVNVGGILRSMEHGFFKAVGVTGFTDTLKAVHVQTLSNHLAGLAGKSFDQLTPEVKMLLSDYGIKAEHWDIFRKHGIQEFSGNKFLTHDSMNGVDPAEFASVAHSSSPEARANAKSDTQLKLANMYYDSASMASVTPDFKTRHAFTLFPRQSVPARLTNQFQTFVGAHLQRFILPHFYASNSNAAFAGKMVGLTMIGTMAYVVNQLRKGLNPLANPALYSSDPLEQAQAYGKLLALGAGYSGVGGIATDYFLNQSLINGRDSSSPKMLGPIGEDIGDVLRTSYKTILDGKVDPKEATMLLINKLPGNNIWWVRSMANYMFLYGLQENLHPGTLRRMEEQAKNNGTPYWKSPSSPLIP